MYIMVVLRAVAFKAMTLHDYDKIHGDINYVDKHKDIKEKDCSQLKFKIMELISHLVIIGNERKCKGIGKCNINYIDVINGLNIL